MLFSIFVFCLELLFLHKGACGQPKFLESLPNLNVTSGRDVSIPCVVDNIGDFQVAWMHINRQILLAIDESTVAMIPRIHVVRNDHRTWTLHIRNVQPEDSGYYVCQVNMEPMINRVAHLQVVVPPKFIDEESSQSHIALQENTDIKLVCRANGIPLPFISWMREDGKRFTTSKGTIETVVESDSLVIRGISRKDMGAYLCIASNKVPPSISKRIVIDVHFPPTINVPNQLVGVPIGTNITLECRVDAFPNAVHYWHFGGQLLINSSRLQTHEERVQYSTKMFLTIRSLRYQDYGTYVCGAKNSLGETESSLKLYELIRQSEEEIRMDPFLREDSNKWYSSKDSKSTENWKRSDFDIDSTSYTLQKPKTSNDIDISGRAKGSPPRNTIPRPRNMEIDLSDSVGPVWPSLVLIDVLLLLINVNMRRL